MFVSVKAQHNNSPSRREPKSTPNLFRPQGYLPMHLSTLGLVPLLFALRTRAQTFANSVTTTDGAQGVLRGCYANVNFNFFDTPGGYVDKDSASVSVQACVQACRTNGDTYAMIQGYNSK